jgi:hypothetical protein
LLGATRNDVDFGLQVVASVAVLAESLLALTFRGRAGLPLAMDIPGSPAWQGDRVIRAALAIGCVAMRSRALLASRECSPSIAIVSRADAR